MHLNIPPQKKKTKTFVILHLKHVNKTVPSTSGDKYDLDLRLFVVTVANTRGNKCDFDLHGFDPN